VEAIRTKVMVEKDLNCIACGSKVTVELQNLFETRFGIEEVWDICRCADCEIEQTVPPPSSEELKDLYETYYNFGLEKGTTYTGSREYFFSSVLYRFWLIVDGDFSFHNQKGFGRLLDLGCNEGRGLSIYQRNGFEAEGLELNEQAAAEARKHGFNVYTDPVEKFQPKDYYDVVVLSNVLEHSLDPKDMLFNVARILKPSGQVWISCPNAESWQRVVFGKYWINWHVPFHITHFSMTTLTNILRVAGFEIQEEKQASPALWFAHSIIARLFAKPGRATRELRNPVLIAFLMLLVRSLFFPFLWIGNILGKGDCLVLLAKKI
jgi:2-polyprenyl-3-methyl-5-hydroxy-6-metoxy-1,4-benzoquinol methylase